MTDKRFNILLIFTDQETAAATRPAARTPRRDALSAHAVTFRQALCTSPQCTPSRGTLLTGLYPHQTGVEANLDAIYARELSPTFTTFGERLGGAGYATAYFGKWHLSVAGPGAHGFGAVGTSEHDDRRIAAAAAAWLAAAPAAPWCAAVSLYNPHDIYQASRDRRYPIRRDASLPSNWPDDLKTKPAPQRRFLADDQGAPFLGAGVEDWLRYRSAYADLLEQVDRDIGVVLEGLATSRSAHRTVVIVTSDHGDLVGAHGLPFKGPCLYDELIHVPLLIACPGLAAAERSELVSLIDIVPTMLDAAGLPPDPALPGRSLRPLLTGTPVSHPRWTVIEYLAKQRWANPIRGLREGLWQYNHYLWGGEELYDLAADPGELRNRASDPNYASTRDRLRDQLVRWRAGAGDDRWDRMPNQI